MKAEDLKKKCPYCDGTGRRTIQSGKWPVNAACGNCKANGWIWSLTMEEMAERTSAAEARVKELEAQVERLTRHVTTTAPQEECPECGCTAAKIFANRPAIITHEVGCSIAARAAELKTGGKR